MVPPTVNDDAELIALAREGDLRAFSTLMEDLQPRLMGQALAFCGERSRAQDLVQETMIAAWKSFGRYDGSCRLFTWLYVILLRQHRRALGWFGRRLPAPTREQLEAAVKLETAATPENDELEDAESQWLRSMVDALPERHREVIRLRFYGEANEAEIAAALGISAGTVKSRLHHALEKLRKMKENLNRLGGGAH